MDVDPIQLGKILAYEWNAHPKSIDEDIREAITNVANRISHAFAPGEKWSTVFTKTFNDNKYLIKGETDVV